jgi:hypothetical protein
MFNVKVAPLNVVQRQAISFKVLFSKLPCARLTALESKKTLKEPGDLKTPKRQTTARGSKTQPTAKTLPGKSSAKLLSGGNPQIAKGDGDEIVQEYISAMPGWKQRVGKQLDVLISQTVPGVRKAVRWNTPFYGAGEQGWFVAFHCLTSYIKVSFFKGTSLLPNPPVTSKQPEVRYVHIHEQDELDERLFADWIRQAAKLPGEKLF